MNKKLQLLVMFLSLPLTAYGNNFNNSDNKNKITLTESNDFFESEFYSQYLTDKEVVLLSDNINGEIEAAPVTQIGTILPPRPPCPVGSVPTVARSQQLKVNCLLNI